MTRETRRIAEIDEELKDLTRTYRHAHLEWTRTKSILKDLDARKRSLIDEKDSLEQGQLMLGEYDRLVTGIQCE